MGAFRARLALAPLFISVRRIVNVYTEEGCRLFYYGDILPAKLHDNTVKYKYKQTGETLVIIVRKRSRL